MRKLLLASAAVLGVAGIAQAQTAVNPINYVPAPVPSVPGSNAPIQGANSGGTFTQSGLAPGQVQVRLNGKFNWYASFIADGDSNQTYWTDSATFPTKATQFSTTGTTVHVNAKNNQGVEFSSYIRLYPGFDGMAANGLRYGVFAEIRQDVGASTSPGAVNGVSGGGAQGSISVQNQKRSYLYWRRAYGYVAGDSWGTLRFGSGDGPSGLFMTGNFENFNDSGWNGDPPGNFSGNVAWPFADVGSVYTTNKVVYLSPQFAGFDLGLSWAPTSNALSNSSGCTLGNLASVGCDRLFAIDASGNTKEQLRQHDFFEAFARYRGTFNGVGLSAYGGYMGAATIANARTLSNQTQYTGMNIGVGGAQVSYAGFAIGGMVQAGDYNRGQGFAPAPKGVDSSVAWLVGASYTTGPIIVGTHYFHFDSPGSFVPNTGFAGDGHTTGVGKQSHEQGLAIGGTYAVAPGFSVFLSYLWGDRHQTGVNMLTGETSGRGAEFHNTYTVQSISLGTQLRW